MARIHDWTMRRRYKQKDQHPPDLKTLFENKNMKEAVSTEESPISPAGDVEHDDQWPAEQGVPEEQEGVSFPPIGSLSNQTVASPPALPAASGDTSDGDHQTAIGNSADFDVPSNHFPYPETNHLPPQFLHQMNDNSAVSGGTVYGETQWTPDLESHFPESFLPEPLTFSSQSAVYASHGASNYLDPEPKLMQPSSDLDHQMHEADRASYFQDSMSLSTFPVPSRNQSYHLGMTGQVSAEPQPIRGIPQETPMSMTMNPFEMSVDDSHCHAYTAWQPHHLDPIFSNPPQPISAPSLPEPDADGQPGPGPSTQQSRDRQEREYRETYDQQWKGRYP